MNPDEVQYLGGMPEVASKVEDGTPVPPPSAPQFAVPPPIATGVPNCSVDSVSQHAAAPPLAPVVADQVPAPLPMLVPSLKGKMVQEGTMYVCKGLWAMSEAQHANPELTSEFEFRINTASPANIAALNAGTVPRAYPLDGLYQGWFKLRKQPPLKGVDKIEEKSLLITFRQDEEEPVDMDSGDAEPDADAAPKTAYVVNGQGSNRFGNFTLKGSFDSATGNIMMYREYVARPLKPIVSQVNRIKRERVSTDPTAIIREGTGRIRKQSSFVTDFDNIQSGTSGSSSGDPNAKKTSMKPEITPAQRIALQFQRCKSLHAEMCRLPAAVYFLEPVDPISLNIPDYPLIVTNPMDLGTIGVNLLSDTIVYQTHGEFADAMRLVFKNAMTYNCLKENPVNIAAKECLAKFEEKYRTQVTSLNAGANRTVTGQTAAKKAAGKKYPGQNRPNSGAASSSSSGGGSSAQRSRLASSSSGGGGGYDYGAIPDGSMAQMQQMQQQMMEMQNELNRLRNAVGQDPSAGDGTRPLTLQEKKDLIRHISDLQPACMEKIVQIVQQGAPERGEYGESDDIEIPLDELDTHTLRKLQAYVSDARKRGLGGGSPAHKRSRPSSAAGGGYVDGSGGPGMDEGVDFGLFSPESL